METITISIPKDCLTYIHSGGVPLFGKVKHTSVDKASSKEKVDKQRRRPNHWMWNNKKEYAKWWYQENREIYKAEVLRKYHEKKKILHPKIGFK